MVGREVTLTRRDSVANPRAPVLSVRNLTLDTVSSRGWRRVLEGRQLRRPTGRNPRNRRIVGIGTHRDSRIDLRRRARLARRRYRHRRRACVDQFGGGRLSPRRGDGDRGSQSARLAHCFDHSGQCRAALGRRRVALRHSRLRSRICPRHGCGRATWRALLWDRSDRRHLVRRQPAEGRYRKVAGDALLASCFSTSRRAALTSERNKRSINSYSAWPPRAWPLWL